MITDLKESKANPSEILEDLIDAGNAENWLWKHMVLLLR